MKHCGNSNDLRKQTSTPFAPSMSISTQLKDCKVVLEDISLSCGAAKLQMLDQSQDKIRTTDSHHTAEGDFLKNLCLKTPDMPTLPILAGDSRFSSLILPPTRLLTIINKLPISL